MKVIWVKTKNSIRRRTENTFKMHQKTFMCRSQISWKWEYSPAGCKFLTYKATRDLCDYVAPEEGAVDHPHRLRVPGELCSLKGRKNILLDAKLTNTFLFIELHWGPHLRYQKKLLKLTWTTDWPWLIFCIDFVKKKKKKYIVNDTGDGWMDFPLYWFTKSKKKTLIEL